MNKKQGSLKLNVILNGFRVGMNLLLPLIVFPYISRLLGPENLGQVSFAKSTTNYFVLLASMGIPSYGVLVCAKARYDKEELQKTICELLYVNVFFMAITYTGFLIMLAVVPKFQALRTLLLINSISIIVTAVGLDWLYSGLEEFKYITIRSFIFKLVSIVLIFLLVRRHNDHIIYSSILVFAEVGSNVLNLIHARKYISFYSLRKLNIRRHLKPIMSLFAASIAYTISANTDTVMLGFMKTDYEVGLYNFSVKIKLMLSTIMTAGLTAFVPRFSYYVQCKQFDLLRGYIRKVFLMTLSIACALTGFTMALCKPIISFLGGEAYQIAFMPVIILTGCVCILACTWTLGVAVLQPLGRENKYARGMFRGCVINVVFNAILIPSAGVTGAAIATLLSEIMIGISFYCDTKDFLETSLSHLKIMGIMIPAALAATCAYLCSHNIAGGCFLQILAGAVVYGVVFVPALLAAHRELRDFFVSQVKSILKK